VRIAYKQAKKLYREIRIDLDEYILLKPKYAVANGIKIKNLMLRLRDTREYRFQNCFQNWMTGFIQLFK